MSPQHTVRYFPGQCAIQAVRDYFNNGTLPAEGTVCEQDYDVFSGKSMTNSFLPQGSATNGTTKPVGKVQAEFTGTASTRWKLGWAWGVVAVWLVMAV
jgi:hypothetical protein